MYPCMYLDEHVAGGPDGGAVDDLALALLHDHVEQRGAQVGPHHAVPHHKVPEKRGEGFIKWRVEFLIRIC